jgi:hypothetical protein
MPNKTIYIKDSDLPLWDRAQQELGESVSSVFVEYLKKRLEAEAERKKAKRIGKIDEVHAMNALLGEVNAALNLEIELHPFWQYPILDQDTLNHGYKLHQKKASPDRVMSLIVSRLDFDSSGRLNPTIRERVTKEIRRFWDGKTSETHRVVDTTK